MPRRRRRAPPASRHDEATPRSSFAAPAATPAPPRTLELMQNEWLANGCTEAPRSTRRALIVGRTGQRPGPEAGSPAGKTNVSVEAVPTLTASNVNPAFT